MPYDAFQTFNEGFFKCSSSLVTVAFLNFFKLCPYATDNYEFYVGNLLFDQQM